MLVSAVEQLQSASNSQQYNQAASNLQAVQQLLESFKSYSRIAKIQQLQEQVSDIQGSLKKKILFDFEQGFSVSGEVSGNKRILADACKVVSILDNDFRYLFFFFPPSSLLNTT